MNFPELAKQAAENYIKEKEIISPPENLPKKFLEKRAGVFVTIEKSKNSEGLLRNQEKLALRGCIGTYLPTRKNIAEEIIFNSIAAATEDYRFGPVRKEELSYLRYTVYVLNKPELAKDIKELDPKKYGVIIKTAPVISPDKTDVVFDGHHTSKSGLLLPDLEGVDTVEKQISIACQKGGINPAREKFLIYKFTVEKHQ